MKELWRKILKDGDIFVVAAVAVPFPHFIWFWCRELVPVCVCACSSGLGTEPTALS